jgi:aryl-alcohol dehydrogenase-like predicted oxidoreductase
VHSALVVHAGPEPDDEPEDDPPEDDVLPEDDPPSGESPKLVAEPPHAAHATSANVTVERSMAGARAVGVPIVNTPGNRALALAGLAPRLSLACHLAQPRSPPARENRPSGFLDTADVYSAWAPGNAGGESETILGRWMKARGNRNTMVVATKIGMAPGLEGLSKTAIRAAAEASLKRLQVDHIDLYYAHRDDPKVPIAESLGAFDELVRGGKVRHVAASQYGVARLAEALAISKREGLARYVALQVNYNLVHRGEYEGELHALCDRERVACLPFYSLAKGFLTGKYRPGAKVESVRAQGAAAFLDARGLRVLVALDAIAAKHATTVAAVALAWLAMQPGVATPVASARTSEQLAELLPFVGLALTGDEVERLTGASG